MKFIKNIGWYIDDSIPIDKCYIFDKEAVTWIKEIDPQTEKVLRQYLRVKKS